MRPVSATFLCAALLASATFAQTPLDRESQTLATCEGVFTLAMERSMGRGELQEARALAQSFGRTSAALLSMNFVNGDVPPAQVEAIRFYREGAREMLGPTPDALPELVRQCRLASDGAYTRQRVMGARLWDMSLEDAARMMTANVRATLSIP